MNKFEFDRTPLQLNNYLYLKFIFLFQLQTCRWIH